MTSSEYTRDNLISRRLRQLTLTGLALALAVVCCAGIVNAQSSQSLVLQEGGSRVLTFDQMKRVVLIDPTVADVVVSSTAELVVYANEVGTTQIYIWDKHGRHQYNVQVTPAPYARQLTLELKQALGPQFFRYEIISGQTLLVDGTVRSAAELDRVTRIIEGLAKQADVINLIAVEDANLNPAQRKAKALQKLLGDQYTYLAWDDKTVLITGRSTSYADLDRIEEIARAASSAEVKISNLVTVDPSQARPPVEEIATAIGPDYTVWAMRGKTVVVEGEARNELAKQRVDQILGAFEDVDIVNLVTVSDMPEVPLAAQRDLLQSALGGGLQVRVVEGKALLVEGLVADDAEAAKVQKIIGLFKKTNVVDLTSVADPERQQVLVRAKVVEINRTNLDKLGVNWGQIAAGAFLDQPFLVQVEGPDTNNIYPIGAQLDALVSNDLARILSEPNLLVNDGETAEMNVGGELPIPVPQAAGGVSNVTIEYKTYGVQLKISPRILPGGEKIELEVHPKVSALDYANAVTISGFNVPALRTRETDTTVTVRSGQPLIISGLVQREQSENTRKIPLLGDLPIIGELFKSKEFQEGKTELVILVTPEIMAGGPSEIPGATEPEIVNPEADTNQ